MSKVIVTEQEFKELFPEFVNSENINIYLFRSKCFVSDNNYGILKDDCRKLVIYLMCAHLLALQNSINKGETAPTAMASASIDKVSVSMIPPPNNDQFEFWLNQTQYGAELLALLMTKITTPILLGGSFVRTLH